MRIVRPHDLGHKFVMLTQIDLELFLVSFLIFLLSWFHKLFIYWQSFFLKVITIIFFPLNLVYLLSLFFNYIIKLNYFIEPLKSITQVVSYVFLL